MITDQFLDNTTFEEELAAATHTPPGVPEAPAKPTTTELVDPNKVIDEQDNPSWAHLVLTGRRSKPLSAATAERAEAASAASAAQQTANVMEEINGDDA